MYLQNQVGKSRAKATVKVYMCIKSLKYTEFTGSNHLHKNSSEYCAATPFSKTKSPPDK